MFTGIVTDIGEVEAITPRASGITIRIATRYDTREIALGASIACAGACLTVVDKADGPANRPWFTVEASVETLDKTTLGSWQAGTRINLERAMRLGDEIGGHLVTGHVDGVAQIIERLDDADMARLRLRLPPAFAPFIAPKGSICLDGTSLTVNEVEGDTFTVMLIPHTLAVTTWGDRRAGDLVNFEIDMMARYVARLIEARQDARASAMP